MEEEWWKMSFVRVVYIFYFKALLYPTPLLVPSKPLATPLLRFWGFKVNFVNETYVKCDSRNIN